MDPLFNYADLKDFVPGIQNDDYWKALITTACDIIKDRAHRCFVEDDYTETFNETKRSRNIFFLREFPITEIKSIEIDGIAITSDDYVLLTTTNVATAVKLLTATDCKVEILYTGGYSGLPSPVRLAVAAAVSVSDQKLKQGIAASESFSSHSVAYQKAEDVFKFIDELLKPYSYKPIMGQQ